MRDKRAINALSKALADEWEKLRAVAACSLGEIGKKIIVQDVVFQTETMATVYHLKQANQAEVL